MKILAGDIGGTKTLLQIAEITANNYHIYAEARFESAAWLGLIPLVEEFLRANSFLPIAIACFAVAGPVDGNKARLTNLAWEDLDTTHLATHFGIDRVMLINDFQAVGYGIEQLQETDLALLQTGQALPYAPRALLGAGTGLGQTIMVWANGHYLPLETEGGHVDFAPQDPEQEKLRHFLAAIYGHVSYERLLSGSGLVDIYRFLCGSKIKVHFHDAAEIAHAALGANDPLARHALHLFARIYGQQAGNLALTSLARGGVYVAGGIAPRILPFLQDGEFMRAFRAKGRMERLLWEIPVRVILNPRVGLLGAAMVATHHSSGTQFQ